VNSDVAALQRVNQGLLRARDGSTNQASLMDERDQLLDSLSGSLPISVTMDAHGAATVKVGSSNGPVLLDSGTTGNLALTVASDGNLSLNVSGTAIAPTTGSLSGLTAAAATIADHRSNLDQLAAQFASDINGANAAGTDANGNPGGPLVSFGGTADSLNAIALTPDKVAAADASSDNGNMLAFSNLRGPTGTEQGWNQLVGANAQTVAAATAENSAASTRHDGAMAARDAVSGVDLDHESADLLRFQQAYEGSARVIQVAKETFQSILNAI
jgi:flagellar hook-associated protein 1 FlgK